MDTAKLKEVYERLEALDDRLGHRLRARGGPARMSLEQVEERVKDLSSYTSDLRDLVRDLVLAFATKTPPRS